VVEGTTQRRGARVRVNARLLLVRDGRALWSGTFDEDIARGFTLQDGLASAVASALALKLHASPAGMRSPCDGADAVAYRDYLAGRYQLDRPSAPRMREALAAFKRAIDRDPTCARAYAGMAFAYRALVMTGDEEPRERFPLAQAAVDRALDDGSATALAVLAFIAVIREGIETSLFLVGQAASAADGAIWVLLGALAGLGVATLLGIGFYHGSRRLDLGSFFRWTGIALVFIAAGLVSKAVHEFIEIGLITLGTQTLFDLSAILPHDGTNVVGQFLRALFGYTATPEATTFVVWLTYVVVVLRLYLRPIKRSSAPTPTPTPKETAATP